jgi:TrpR-related protein YerC/YecD
MSNKFKDPLLDQFFAAVLTLQNEEQCARFFEDLCTIAELKSISTRLEVARLLSEGEIYDKIAAQTGASTATIARVKSCLNYGEDGYNLVLPQLKAEKSGAQSGKRAGNAKNTCKNE